MASVDSRSTANGEENGSSSNQEGSNTAQGIEPIVTGVTSDSSLESESDHCNDELSFSAVSEKESATEFSEKESSLGVSADDSPFEVVDQAAHSFDKAPNQMSELPSASSYVVVGATPQTCQPDSRKMLARRRKVEEERARRSAKTGLPIPKTPAD